MKRESFKSRLGFLLIAAGCAIGIGNVWRFPYKMCIRDRHYSSPLILFKIPAASVTFQCSAAIIFFTESTAFSRSSLTT